MKNEKGISLVSICLIIAILIILALGGYVYYLTTNEKETETKVEEKIVKVEDEKITDKEAEEAIRLYYEKINVSNVMEYLRDEKLIDFDDEDVEDDGTERIYPVKFEDFKEAVLNYMTEDCFEKLVGDAVTCYSEKNGNVSITYEEDYDSKLEIEIEDLERFSDNNFSFTYKFTLNGVEYENNNTNIAVLKKEDGKNKVSIVIIYN